MTTPYIKKKNKAKKYILWTIIALLILTLIGCTKTTPTSESIANSAQESINALKQTIKPECKTKAIESQINAAQTAIKATITACESEKEVITQEKIRWKWSFLATIIIIAAYIARKVMK